MNAQLQTSGATAVFQVSIVAIRGATAQSDVAIDDVQLYDGVCQQGACNFENGLCSWHQVYDDDTNWSFGVVSCVAMVIRTFCVTMVMISPW